jgi:nicotinate-nucleotide pyrophosphorylase (carboxylating)
VTETARKQRSRSMLSTVEDDVLQLIDIALTEDIGSGDVTTRWTVHARSRLRARVLARSAGIVAGLTPSLAVFVRLDGRIETNRLAEDGQPVKPGDVLYELKGPARAILTGERVALNILQRLSGVATLTRAFVDAVAGTGARILDTRKTTPGWRTLEKTAVLAGGGVNHRQGLFDAILIKENHIAAAGGIREAIDRVTEQNTRDLTVTVEVTTQAELEDALDGDVDRVLLDNMDPGELRKAVRTIRRRSRTIEIEASGNMTLDRVREVADTGVDCISVGSLTHSAPALDVSLEVLKP